MNYTSSQHTAIITHDHNLQIIACAGSGKTQVISARIIELLKQKKSAGITPANIVAFTFTEKAAGELKERIHRLAHNELGTTQGMAEMFIGTIHGYCLNLLQSPPLYRYLKYNVLADLQQRLFVDRYSIKSGLTSTPLINGGTLERWKGSSLFLQVLSILGEGEVDLRKVPAGVQAAVRQYYDLLHAKRYLDYTSIIAEAVAEIKTNNALRDALRDQVKYLVVDEYQDVNPLQEMLVAEMHKLGANLCVVGDDDQTIYQWRGSDVGNIISFANRYPNVKPIALNENFRSSLGVVVPARQVVARNPQRLPKQMESTGAQPFQRGDILSLSFDTPATEASWIAQKINALYGTAYHDRPDATPRGLSYSDFAVLLRSVRNDAAPIRTALEQAGIPYVVTGMNGLFDTPEIQAMQQVFYYLAGFTPQNGTPATPASIRAELVAANLGLSAQQLDAGVAFVKQRKALIGDRLDADLYLQRVYLDLLECLGLREEAIPGTSKGAPRGEIVYYNLGKFSQVISDYEGMHFDERPIDLYPGFAKFLYYEAPGYYPEGWEAAGAVKPDAVQIMTVHQAKGMQWPAVFVPALRQNRFPAKGHGGRTVWHVIPETAVKNVARYKGSVEDERRLFYVAVTRAEKYLFCSWSPLPGNRNQQQMSVFLRELTTSEQVLTREPPAVVPERLPAQPRRAERTLALTFSELKHYFECPYMFKLRFLYGFDEPLSRALGYGRSLHNALAEIHAESLHGNISTVADVPRLVDEHLHLPYANRIVEDNLRKAAQASLTRYLNEHGHKLDKLEHVEKIIELNLGDGIVVNGRIDLIRRTDTEETVIVDFKSDERAQAESLTEKQLQIYAVGYQELTGQRADMIEVHNLDKGGAKREVVDDTLVQSTLQSIVAAGKKLRENVLPRLALWDDKCGACNLCGICRTRPTAKPTV